MKGILHEDFQYIYVIGLNTMETDCVFCEVGTETGKTTT
jgi:hypothetical protein